MGLSAQDAAAVRGFCAHMASVEPGITQTMQRTAARSSADMYGLEYAVKAEDRVMEKVSASLELAEADVPVEEALPVDALRYTFGFDDADYCRGATEVNADLISQGFTLERARNTWETPGYDGVNCVYQTPAGDLVEVQYHTPESFQAKQDTHAAYEEQRSPGTSDARRMELVDEQNERFAQTPEPPGVGGLHLEPGASGAEVVHEGPTPDTAAAEAPDIEASDNQRPGLPEAGPAESPTSGQARPPIERGESVEHVSPDQVYQPIDVSQDYSSLPPPGGHPRAAEGVDEPSPVLPPPGVSGSEPSAQPPANEPSGSELDRGAEMAE